MPRQIDLNTLLAACSDDSFEDGIRIDSELEPCGGPGSPVKPAVYEGGVYQTDRRWASPSDDEPTDIIVIDNVPSQANRLEEALRRHRSSSRVPELVLDLSDLTGLPAHLPRRISSLEFPHRNADAYLRDAKLGGEDFIKTDLGRAIFGATAQECGPLMAWFPQALLYGFWQSHLGKKRSQHQACASLGLGDRGLEASGGRHQGVRPEGRSPEPEHGRGPDFEPGRPTGLGDGEGKDRGWEEGQALRDRAWSGAVHG